ncbi:MAG: T9SS type A sorting domain-containing protein [Taibaiella sp.]|nr:T9SS type A sorting domain-containing protein [Taibaiella sp.]
MKKYLLYTLLLLLLTSATAYSQVIYTVAGTGTQGYSGDGGPATAAQLYEPYGVVLDDSGNLYICDVNNGCIRKVSPAYGGIIKTIVGTGSGGYSGDNGLGIHAQLNGAYDVGFDHKGNVYIPDAGNSRLRKLSTNDTITTIAGTGVAGYNGDNIPAVTAKLNQPTGITLDSAGNIYIVDYLNYRIRKIDTSGIITTIAGTGIGGFSPDGSRADTAKLKGIYSLRTDKKGNLFFADNARIRMIDAAGFITTIAGNGTRGYGGDGGLATDAEIGGGAIDLDSTGNLFIADDYSDRIRKVNTAGIITTVAGGGGVIGDGGNPLSALLAVPQGVAVNNLGDIYIGAVGQSRVRLVTNHLDVNPVSSLKDNIMIFPNPCHNNCNIQLNTPLNEQAEIVISNVNGMGISRQQLTGSKPLPITPGLPQGIYIINVTTQYEHFTAKLIIQ